MNSESIFVTRRETRGRVTHDEIRAISRDCDNHGIKHDLSSTYTPQQNRVVKRNNITLSIARTMLDEYGTSERFWAEAINNACYASNRFYLHRLLKKIAYELLVGRK